MSRGTEPPQIIMGPDPPPPQKKTPHGVDASPIMIFKYKIQLVYFLSYWLPLTVASAPSH